MLSVPGGLSNMKDMGWDEHGKSLPIETRLPPLFPNMQREAERSFKVNIKESDKNFRVRGLTYEDREGDFHICYDVDFR